MGFTLFLKAAIIYLDVVQSMKAHIILINGNAQNRFVWVNTSGTPRVCHEMNQQHMKTV